MWLEIYPKFDRKNHNDIFYFKDNIIECVNHIGYKKTHCIELGLDSFSIIQISLKNVIGVVKEIKISEEENGFIGNFNFINNDFGLQEEDLKDFALALVYDVYISNNIGNISNIYKVCLVHKNEVMTQYEKRKKKRKAIINKLLNQ